MLTLTVVLAVIWLLSMAWMRRNASRSIALSVNTAAGVIWVESAKLPRKGERISAYGHPEDGSGRYDPGQAQWGCLEHRATTGYVWQSTGRKRYT